MMISKLSSWSHLIKRCQSTYKWSYVNGTAQEPLLGITLGQLVNESAEKFGDTDALISMHQGPLRKSFAQVKEDSDTLAAGFLALGLEPGDRVGIWGPNSYEWYQTQMAAAKAGLVLVNVNPAYKSHELKYCINKVGIKALVSARAFKHTDYYKLFCELATNPESFPHESIPSLQHLILMPSESYEPLPKGAISFDDILHAGQREHAERIASLENFIQMDDPVNIQFTSGTTGNPKGACLSHHNIINNARFIGLRLGYDKQKHRVCLCVPLYHTFGCVIGNICSLMYGAANVLPGPHFNANDCLNAIAAEKCTSVYGTPTMFTDMIAAQKSDKRDVSSLSTGIMSGAPCPEKLCQDAVNVLNLDKFTTCYGMTETSPVTFQGFPSDSLELRTTTIGYPSAHTEVKVIDEAGKVVPVGTPGELCSRGYAVMLGYWNDQEKTEEIISKEGWLHSGQ